MNKFPLLSKMLGSFGKTMNTSISMRIRLIAFLSIIVIVMVLGIFIVLYTSGIFSIGREEAERDVERDFQRIYSNLSAQLGDATVQLVSLSQALSRSIEMQLSNKNISVSDLQKHPNTLEEIIAHELNLLKLALERTKCSGVFMVLDATVNPALPNANNSRAGIHIRIQEPSVPGAPDLTYLYYRGFPEIAYNNSLLMQVIWEMEFDVEDSDFFHVPIKNSKETSLPLSYLYYWSMESILSQPDDAILVCSIPLVDSAGYVFGVCGFEISAVNYMFAYAPDDSDYKSIFSIFAELDDNKLQTQGALIAGRNTATNVMRDTSSITITAGSSLNIYETDTGVSHYGLHGEIQIYPINSPFQDQRFVLSVLVSRSEIDTLTYNANMRLILGCVALIILGICISIYISKRYLSPIEGVFEAVRLGNLDGLHTNIVEIDRMIDQIRNLRLKGTPFPDDFFSDFIKRTETLSPVEKKVFNYSVDGAPAKVIMSALFITKDALRKHNQRIYEKLGVSGSEALMLYIELIKMSGQTVAIDSVRSGAELWD